jgi:predicted dienelactone hydrolase
MKKSFLYFLVAACALVVPGIALAADTNALYQSAPGPFAVETVRYDWHDAKRDRNVPVKIYYPESGDGPFPVIIFSHGLGGSREGYAYLGNHWASHGYISVHVQHLGSDSAVWQDVPPAERLQALRRSVLNLQNSLNRPLDISFAIDQLTKMNSEDLLLKHRLDLDHIGVAGHSFGGFTTLAVAGEVFFGLTGNVHSDADPRVKAAIAMSAPAPLNKRDLDASFAKIKIPIFHMTGTLDDSPIGETKAGDRRIPFDHIKNAQEYLVTFKDADHMVFSGHIPGQGGGERDPFFQKFILSSSTAFWDAYLKDDTKAKKWLADGGFESVLGADGKFEEKNVGTTK